MSSKSLVICLPRDSKTRLRSLTALVHALIERDRSPVTPIDRLTVMRMSTLVQFGTPLSDSADALLINARNVLVAGMTILNMERERPEAVDVWLDWNWRGLTHPEEFPVSEGLSIGPEKTNIDQRNRVSYLVYLMSDEELQRFMQQNEKELHSTADCSQTMPPF